MATKKILLGGLLVLVVVFLAAIFGMKSTDTGDGTELLFAMVVHRHGDRTPRKKEHITDLNLYNDEIEALVHKWGYGQITDAGLKTSYKTGEFIRRRYDSLISAKYNYSEIYIRASDMTRTKVSALTAMAAVYRPTGDSWSQDVNWVPVPYSTIPVNEDFLQPWHSCPKYWKLLLAKIDNPTILLKNKNKDVAEKLVRVSGKKDFGTKPINIFHTYDVCTALIKMGCDIGSEISEMYADLSSAADDVYDYTFASNDDMLQLTGGALLEDFFIHTNKIISGKDTYKVVVYSAHDLTVYSLEAATAVPRQGMPKFGSLLSLELRRDVKTGRYFVLPVYLSDPHEGVEKYLQVEGCDSVLCDFEQFSRLTAQYRINHEAWKTKCSVHDDENNNKVL